MQSTDKNLHEHLIVVLQATVKLIHRCKRPAVNLAPSNKSIKKKTFLTREVTQTNITFANDFPGGLVCQFFFSRFVMESIGNSKLSSSQFKFFTSENFECIGTWYLAKIKPVDIVNQKAGGGPTALGKITIIPFILGRILSLRKYRQSVERFNQ